MSRFSGFIFCGTVAVVFPWGPWPMKYPRTFWEKVTEWAVKFLAIVNRER